MFKKILIANRGEIALRVIRACRELGIKSVAIHSTADNNSMHVRLADESICIGPPSSRESYLNMPAIVSAATIVGADAIHPGVGFLSENAEFVRMVEEHDFVFIGPSAEHTRIMGDKIAAKNAVKQWGIPVVPGTEKPISSEEEARSFCQEIGYPVLIKAAGGGGGKGMQIVYKPEFLSEALSVARNEAKVNFGNDQVFIEKFLVTPRHIEIQVLADHYGNAVHLGERDCSIQRRHQKVWEEAPSPVLSSKERSDLGECVIKAVKGLGYRGAGTFEFLYENGQFYFIEMNTRIQVEHPVTEMITGVDLVRNQILIASGEKLPFTQEDIQFKGHAIECRVNAENSETFMPSPGKITAYHTPGGPGVRIDSHLYNGYTVPPHYDSLISKLVVFGDTREQAIKRVERALKEYVISGIDTNIPLHQKLCVSSQILSGNYHIHWLEEWLGHLQGLENA
jgi:acetyl-CoA carboxylase biotin carboxylase subunit